MKRYIFAIITFASLFIWSSCSSEENEEVATDEQQVIGFIAEINDMDINSTVQTRAAGDFSVNTNLDPTTASRTTGWELNILIYNRQINTNVYNQAICEWGGSNWKPVTPIYLPNYLRQNVEASLYPAGWTSATPIVLNQSDPQVLLAQDILVQSGYPSKATITPAHIPSVPMQHQFAMLDFILNEVDSTQIDKSSIKVIVGNDIYTPYRVANTTDMEYLVILPLDVINPKVTLTTIGGIKYIEEIKITSIHPNGTRSNFCYCANLQGVELSLSSVTVADWEYGTAIAGQYTTIASNPTFTGPVGDEVTLVFDNGEQQTIYFNRWGEATIKPAGRTIIQLIKSDGTPITLNPAIVLNDMYIDLTSYLS